MLNRYCPLSVSFRSCLMMLIQFFLAILLFVVAPQFSLYSLRKSVLELPAICGIKQCHLLPDTLEHALP